MHYIGVDYHKKYSYMVVKNEDGRVEGRGTVNNTKEKVQQFNIAQFAIEKITSSRR